MAVGRLGPRSPRREEGAMTSEVRPDTAVLVRERLSRDADDPDALFTLAALRANDGDLDEALPILDRVLRIDPRYPGAWILKAKLHGMRGEPDAAAAASARAQEMGP
ncbi:MAG: hypothetical protein A3K59_02730 [Euryarchaeota archaeon RBG_19FT_COMBO_69_17]|nr:MAG: hypothetical protein A3K59_02730 [Euryarchaeota archaeon RBG_19FT_COMBO_69_17]